MDGGPRAAPSCSVLAPTPRACACVAFRAKAVRGVLPGRSGDLMGPPKRHTCHSLRDMPAPPASPQCPPQQPRCRHSPVPAAEEWTRRVRCVCGCEVARFWRKPCRLQQCGWPGTALDGGVLREMSPRTTCTACPRPHSPVEAENTGPQGQRGDGVAGGGAGGG